MGEDFAVLGCWGLAWLVGGVPSGVILATFCGGPDPRSAGSGNIGATNAFRVGGRRLGLLTLLADAGKGIAVAALALGALGGTAAVSVAVLLAVIGHCYSPYLGLKGGKGVAVGLGAWLVLAPWAALAAAGLWAGVLARWRTSSLAALVAASALPVLVALSPGTRRWLPATLVVTALVAWRHRENVARLAGGAEPRF